MRACFCRPWNVVRQRTGILDLESCDVANGKTKHSSECHHTPKPEFSEAAEVGKMTQLSKHKNEWKEEDTGIDVVVVGQFPDVSIHCWHHLLSVDGIQRDTSTGQYPKKDTWPREWPSYAFLVHTKPETTCVTRIYVGLLQYTIKCFRLTDIFSICFITSFSIIIPKIRF